jgi:hypothetical protein
MTQPAWQGAAVLVLAGLAYDVLLASVRRVDRTYRASEGAPGEGDPRGAMRWLGYARDASNLLGFLLFLAGFVILGFAGPPAVLAAALSTLGFYGLDFFLARTLRLRRPQTLFFVIALGFAVVLAAVRAPVANGLSSVVARLYA